MCRKQKLWHTCDSLRYNACIFMHAHRITKKSKIELGTEPSPYIDGLKLNMPLSECKDKTPLKITDPKNSVIVGSIRMGFGHHRIAQSASTWGGASLTSHRICPTGWNRAPSFIGVLTELKIFVHEVTLCICRIYSS
jgi:hypothetical protein